MYTYTITSHETNPSIVLVTNPSGYTYSIHKEDADPEHRFLEYRFAANWFGNFSPTQCLHN